MASHTKRVSGTIVKNTPSPEKTLLLEAAQAKNANVTSKQIDRWRHEDLLPKAIARGRGRARGIARSSGETTLPQVVALVEILKRNRSFDHAAFRLWVRGYEIPLRRVRKALENLATKAFDNARMLSEDNISGQAIALQDKMVRERNAPKQTRRLAREGRLAPAVEIMLRLTLDKGDATQEQRHAFARDFSDLASLDKARLGEQKLGVSGWLTEDPSNSILESLDIVELFSDTMRTLSDHELNLTRQMFNKFERIVSFFKLVQDAAKDEASLGTTLLTRSIVGVEGQKMGPEAFAALAVLGRAKPTLSEKINEISASVDVTLEKFKEAGIKIPQY